MVTSGPTTYSWHLKEGAVLGLSTYLWGHHNLQGVGGRSASCEGKVRAFGVSVPWVDSVFLLVLIWITRIDTKGTSSKNFRLQILPLKTLKVVEEIKPVSTWTKFTQSARLRAEVTVSLQRVTARVNFTTALLYKTDSCVGRLSDLPRWHIWEVTTGTEGWALNVNPQQYPVLASHNPRSEWPSGFGSWQISTPGCSREHSHYGNRIPQPSFFRPNQAAVGEGRLLTFSVLLHEDSAPTFSLLSFSTFLPTPPLPLPNPPKLQSSTLLDLSRWKVGSFLKEWPFLAPGSWGFSNFMLRKCFHQLLFQTYPAETSQSHPLWHKTQGHTRQHCIRLQPGKCNATVCFNFSVRSNNARLFLSQAAARPKKQAA